MNANAKEIEPCPFCGSDSVQVEDFIYTHGKKRNVWVDCPDCPCGFHMEFDEKDNSWREAFIKKWNGRGGRPVQKVSADKPASPAKPVIKETSSEHYQEKLF